MISKEKRLNQLKQTIENSGKIIDEEIKRIQAIVSRPLDEIIKLNKEDKELALHLKAQSETRLQELISLKKSPFFSKCNLAHKTIDARQNKERTIYFGKHEFSEANIYSWIAPIATIRFADPGITQFKLPNGKTREVNLYEKDQYMIIDEKPIFFTHEEINSGRELVYQEHFSIKKGAFVLPEIVEVMEKAQDDIIRAPYYGPFTISGPAGSGKTTLALHRVAYLVQSPETTSLYPKNSIIVFVQDIQTKDYFSHLLPELGIHDVEITTFFEWAKSILQIEDLTLHESSLNLIEKIEIKDKFTKEGGLENTRIINDIFPMLKNIYRKYGSKELQEEFDYQIQSSSLDIVDITIFLHTIQKKRGKLEIIEKTNRVKRMGKIVTHTKKRELRYSLIVVDEFQNYLPEQLSIFKSCLHSDTQSIVYVGDMSQKIKFGTVTDWFDFEECISTERIVKLHKVYRNTKQILSYINDLGYMVEIPEMLKEGPVVVEKASIQIKDIQTIIDQETSEANQNIGVLTFSKRRADELKNVLRVNGSKGVHISSIEESQGVEFDTVILVIDSKDLDERNLSSDISEKYEIQNKKICKDIIYIGLTRAINKMYVQSTIPLKIIVSKLL